MKFSDQDSYATWKCLRFLKIESSVRILLKPVQIILIAFIVTTLLLYQMTFCSNTVVKVTQVSVMTQHKQLKWTLQVLVRMHLDTFTS